MGPGLTLHVRIFVRIGKNATKTRFSVGKGLERAYADIEEAVPIVLPAFDCAW